MFIQIKNLGGAIALPAPPPPPPVDPPLLSAVVVMFALVHAHVVVAMKLIRISFSYNSSTCIKQNLLNF